jgi:hypothetical protein
MGRIEMSKEKAALPIGKDGSFKMRRFVWFPASREERREGAGALTPRRNLSGGLMQPS